jgi:putative peptide zinc metalloprotease protein
VSERPSLAPGVVVKMFTTKDDVYAMVKEPVTRSYYKFEEWEGDFIALLDGTRTLQEVADELAVKHPTRGLDLQYVIDGVETLRPLGIIDRGEQERHLVMMDKLKHLRKKRLYDAEHSTIFQAFFPIFDPDKLLNTVIPYIRWVWSPWFVLPWLAVFIVVFFFLIHNWDLYWAGFFGLWNLPQKTFWEIVGFLTMVFLVSIWHELGHGLTCKRYGGEVHDIGFMFLYFSPAFYCRIDDAYMFPKREHRMYCCFGGAYFEMMLCSIACAGWLLTPAEWTLHKISLTLVFFTGLSVILFNINPLIRLDGYYVLMDWLQVPGLREASFEYLGNIFKKRVLHLEVPNKAISRRRRRIFLIYGILAISYSSFVLFVIFSLLRRWLVGWTGPAGYLLLAAIVLLAFRGRIKKGVGFVRYVWSDKRDLFRSPRVAGPAIAAILLVLVLLTFVRTPTRIEAPFTAIPGVRAVVRAPAEGTVRRVSVAEGQRVRRGEVLAEIENPDLTASSLVARAGMVRAGREAALARAEGATALEMQRRAEARAEEARAAIYESRVASLQLTAPIDGIVATPLVEDSLGRHLAEGETFCAIDGQETTLLMVKASERDIEEIVPGTEVRLLVTARPDTTVRSRVLSLAPMARPAESGEQLDLIRRANLVTVHVEVENAGGLLRDGMTGRVQFLTTRRSVVGKVWRVLYRWMGELLW